MKRRRHMNIILKEVNSDNFYECIELKVAKAQENFVASNVFSIAQSKVEPECYPLCIYDEDVMVGFTMYGIDTDDNNMWISRLMVDEKHQRKGYGREAMIKLIELIKDKHNYSEIYLSTEPENEGAQKLYESLGFKNTGKIIEDEVVFIKEI